MSATEAALDQHMRMIDRHFQELEEYEDALEALLWINRCNEEKENSTDDESSCTPNPKPRD